MTDREWNDFWSELLGGIVLVGDADRLLPDDGHLDSLERVLDMKLPRSYRSFVKVFGPGILFGAFVVYAPGYRGAHTVDFLSHNKWQTETASRRPESDRIQGMIAFADVGYVNFAWDRSDVTDLHNHEYRIVRILRDDEDPLVEVAVSFCDFVERVCLQGAYWSIIGEDHENCWEDEDGGLRHDPCFEPAGGSPRSGV